MQSERNWWWFDNNIKIHSSYSYSRGNVPINSIEGLDTSTYPGQPLETPAHLNFWKQPVPCLNSPLHKLYMVVKCSSQKNKCLQIMNTKKKRLKSRHFLDLTWFWWAIELQSIYIYITRSRSDTSDTSHLQTCSPNVVCYFWSPCRTTIRLNSRFFTFTLLHLTHISSSNISLHPGNRQMLLSLVRGHKRGTNTAKLHSITYRYHTE